MDLTQAFFNKRLDKFVRGVFFVSPSFGGQFELNPSSPT